jgi:hypothetical protein
MEEVKEYSLEERLNHVSVWRNSGLLLANYSRQTGIPIKTLRYWATIETKNARRQRKKMSAGFLPVAICDEPVEPPCQIIIEFPKGIRITLGGSVRAEFIKELLS